jgi:hypothetical protein
MQAGDVNRARHFASAGNYWFASNPLRITRADRQRPSCGGPSVRSATATIGSPSALSVTRAKAPPLVPALPMWRIVELEQAESVQAIRP